MKIGNFSIRSGLGSVRAKLFLITDKRGKEHRAVRVLEQNSIGLLLRDENGHVSHILYFKSWQGLLGFLETGESYERRQETSTVLRSIIRKHIRRQPKRLTKREKEELELEDGDERDYCIG